MGEGPTAAVGLVPGTYVQRAEGQPPPSDAGGGAPDGAAAAGGPGEVAQVLVLADFHAEEQNELAVLAGERLVPTGALAPEGWIHVAGRSGQGLVPFEFVDVTGGDAEPSAAQVLLDPRP